MADFRNNLSIMNISPGISRYSWGEIIYNPQSTLGPLVQQCYQLVLLHSGSVAIDLGQSPFQVAAGEMIFLVPGQRVFFRFSPDTPTHHSWIHAFQESTGDGWSAFRGMETVVQPISPRMGFLIRELLGFRDTGSTIDRRLCAGLAAAAFHEFFNLAGFSLEIRRPPHPAVERALSVMKSNYTDPLDLGEIARAAGLSRQHLGRLFREETGMTPVRMLWRIREDEGARLLRETGLTIAGIADACGFQNPYHFTRRIRERFGMPPRTLRLRYWRGTGES